ncbi:hypothetical protein BDP27DRAFT_1533038 [Rhodocollybia butyracea]|uniref:Uncharacterized protein n=1 Tax=Rhodocollybia butyracea TaxID=206335 RepID=A0A9P5TV20_9AGAR|nr:hypothetical protein BDP27DRAFT_1533038 [Rhodocollybia butyracea]
MTFLDRPAAPWGLQPACAKFPSTPSVKKDRVNAGNPRFGLVEGVAKGGAAFDIYREKALPKPCTTRGESTKMFHKRLPVIVRRCEQLSAETGCWLYLATAHPNSRSPFVHYTSQRLLQEPSFPLLDELHNTANKMFYVLKNTQHSTASSLATDLHNTNEKLAEAQLEANQLRAELERLSRLAKENRLTEDLLSRLPPPAT